jgi:hydroxymethylglutaryl-CoA reductase (NADPH)
VIVDVTIPKEVVSNVFHTTPAAMERQRIHAAYGHSTMGQMGTVSGNVANVLAAMYIACGQDPACVAEGHVGIARFEKTDQGDLHCSLTLPGLLVATVGGGTSLPSQSACLSIMNCKSANELAEVIGSVCLAGELSITASFCTDEFAKAHFNLARTPKL